MTESGNPQEQSTSEDRGAKKRPGPCNDSNGGGGTPAPPQTGCKCTSHVTCSCETKLPTGTLRRILEELRKELLVPSSCEGVSRDAKTEFEKALDECEKEYQGLDAIVRSYHDFHCAIDCKLDEVEGWCEDIKNWSDQLPEDIRKAIAKAWRECYEEEEHDLFCCCWRPADQAYTALGNCLEQAKHQESTAKDDLELVKGFETTLKARFEDIKKLYGEAKKHLDAKEPKKVYAVLLEYRKVYHKLGHLLLSTGYVPPKGPSHPCDRSVEPLPDDCARPDLKPLDQDWLRGCLISALTEVIRAKYLRYCWHQQWLDAECERDRCRKLLDEFRKTRREKFILEAQDCEPEPTTQTAS